MTKGFAPHNCADAPNQLTLCCSELTQHLQSYFNDIKDPRWSTRAHLLTDILMISILAVMAGAQGWEDIETYGLSKQAWLEEFWPCPTASLCRYVSTGV